MVALTTDPKRFAIVAITRDEAIIWREGLDSVNPPLRIKAPVEVDHRHRRTGQFHHGHDTNHRFPDYFESVANELSGAEAILVMGHGKGNGSYGSLLIDHLNQKHRDLGLKVVDLLTVNLPALSIHEVEAHARGWFEEHHGRLSRWHGRKGDRRLEDRNR